jgi:Protein of unknown function (DUF3611)
MLQALGKMLRPSKEDSLAHAFSRLGWIGFWIQVAIGAVPLLLLIYSVIIGQSAGAGTRSRLLIIEFLTFVGLLVLVFSAVWSYRYTRLANRLADKTKRPSEFAVQRTAWIGIAANGLGVLFSMLVMLFEVAQLLIYFLRAPQAGVPAIQTTAGGQASWVSAADMMNLMALIFTMFGELTVLAFSLWLLFRATKPSAEFPYAGEES